MVCWGVDDYGESSPPAAVNGSAGTASSISAGFYHTCAVQAGTGSVVCWGYDGEGQATPPASVDDTAGAASAVSGGQFHSLAIAMPEPNATALLASGVAALLLLGGRRIRNY